MTDFNIDQLVELQDQYSNVYERSPTGARGWVRGRRQMRSLDPEIFIEWDKSHWRYHGEPDGWTFEHHFRPVSSEPLDFLLHQADPSPDSCPHCEGNHSLPSPRHEEFLNTLLDAQEAAINADGYFIIALTPRTEQQLTIYEPEIFHGSLNDAARKMIEAQLVHVAAQLFSVEVLNQVQGIEDESGQ